MLIDSWRPELLAPRRQVKKSNNGWNVAIGQLKESTKRVFERPKESRVRRFVQKIELGKIFGWVAIARVIKVIKSCHLPNRIDTQLRVQKYLF